MAMPRIARPPLSSMVNEQCLHSSSIRDCEFFVARKIKEEIQQVSIVNNRPATAGCCNAATKRLSNTLFSVVISDRKRKEVSHGTHTFLECSDDQCSVPLHRNDDLHLRRSSEKKGQGEAQTLPKPIQECMAPETAPCIFISGKAFRFISGKAFRPRRPAQRHGRSGQSRRRRTPPTPAPRGSSYRSGTR